MSEERDEFLEAILRGGIPDELKTSYQHITKEGFAELLAILTFAFVETHIEIRQSYTSLASIEHLNRELLYQLASSLKTITEENMQTQGLERQSIQKVLSVYFQAVENLLGQAES